MRFWNKSLIARLVTYFLALSVIGVIATMLITLAIVRSLLTSSIYDRLNAVATLKENEINRWVNDQRDELSYLAVKPDLRVHVRTLSAAEEDPAKYAAAHDAILEILTRAAESHPSFSEVFLMSSVGGKVLVSTEKGNEGQYRVSDSYYTQGRLDSYIQNVYISPQTGQPTMTISAPVRDADGKLLGVLATHINLDRLDSIILQRAGLGKSGETYIVDRFNNFISVARFGERGFPRGVHTQGIDAALRGVNGAAMYKNYNGIPVIGVYRWVEEREIALLAEINQSEALAPVQRVAALIILSGFTIVVLLTLGIFRLARQIAHPLLAINNAANQMATGDLEARAPVLTEDEIGTLAAAFNTMAGQIKQLVSGLEQRVAERTVELEIANKHNAERAVRLKTIAEVNRAISSIRELKPLLLEITQQISDALGHYHVGIFLIDSSGENAILSAANSIGGQRMLARGHRLQVGQTGIVGFVTASGKPRIALDVGEDAFFFNNPDLPDTRSEIALPLRVSDRIIGALDVQSTTPNAFTPDDVETLEILADQVAIAIENARLFEETRRALAEAETLQQQYLQEKWNRVLKTRKPLGYRYAVTGAEPLEEPLKLSAIQKALRTGTPVQETEPDGVASLAIPLRLRGESIGAITVRLPNRHRWEEDEIDVAQAIADRLALAIENARLFEETTRRELRERTVSEITTKIRSKTDPESMIQTALAELRRVLGASHAEILPYTPLAEAKTEEKGNSSA